MSAKSSNKQEVRSIITKCLSDGFGFSFFLPDEKIRNPSWEELKDCVADAYAMALADVLDAMDGNPQALHEAMSDEGRLFLREKDKELLISLLEEKLKATESSASADDKQGE